MKTFLMSKGAKSPFQQYYAQWKANDDKLKKLQVYDFKSEFEKEDEETSALVNDEGLLVEEPEEAYVTHVVAKRNLKD